MKDKTRIKLTKPHVLNGFRHAPGRILEVSAGTADFLKKRGRAVAAKASDDPPSKSGPATKRA